VGKLLVNMESLRDKALLITDDHLHALVEVILSEHTAGMYGGRLCNSCSQRWPCAEIVALHKWLG